MIVMNNAPATTDEKTGEFKSPIQYMFCKEMEAYCSYKDWLEHIEDPMLEAAVEEIMFDEYLHAKFLRDYMIDKGMYPYKDEDAHEKKFWKIQRRVFHA